MERLHGKVTLYGRDLLYPYGFEIGQVTLFYLRGGGSVSFNGRSQITTYQSTERRRLGNGRLRRYTSSSDEPDVARAK